jgi:PST family polysaccharide transporter
VAASPRIGTAVKRGYIWNLLNFAVSQGASLVIFVVLSRALTPATFGVFALAAVLVDLFAEGGRWSSTDAIVQRQSFSSTALSTAFFSLLGIGILLTAVCFAGAHWAAYLTGEAKLVSVLPALAATLLIVPGTAVMDALVLRHLDFRSQAIRSMIGIITGGAAGLAVAFSPAFEWALVAQRLTASVVTLLVLSVLTRWLPTPEFDKRFAMDFLRRAFNLWAATVLATMHWRALQAAVGIRSGAGSLGQLTVAQRFEAALHGPLTGPIQSLWVPTLSALRTDRAECWRLFLRLSQLTSLLIVPAFLGLSLVGQDIVKLVLDERYRQVGDILFVIGLQGFSIPVGFFCNLIFAGLDRTELSLKFSIAQLCVSIPAIWVVAAHGPVWAQATTLIIVAAACFAATCVQVRMLGGRVSDLAVALMPAYLSGLAMFSVVLTLKLMLPFPAGLTRLLCLVTAGVVTYCGWILIFHRREVIEAWRLISYIRSSSPGDHPA